MLYEVITVSGNIAIGGTVGVGVAAGISTITKTTSSYIAANAQVTALAKDGDPDNGIPAEDSFTAYTGTFTAGATVNDAQKDSATTSFFTSQIDATTSYNFV